MLDSISLQSRCEINERFQHASLRVATIRSTLEPIKVTIGSKQLLTLISFGIETSQTHVRGVNTCTSYFFNFSILEWLVLSDLLKYVFWLLKSALSKQHWCRVITNWLGSLWQLGSLLDRPKSIHYLCVKV